MVNATKKLRDLGQSLWLDSVTRRLLTCGTLHRYIQEFSVSGLAFHPSIFEQAIQKSHDYDYDISQKLKEGKSTEALLFELAIEDLRQAADLFQPIHKRTTGVDGWVSLDVPPRLAHDTAGTVAEARKLNARVGRPNLFIRIPATKEGLLAIEESIFVGVPINVTLLFSRSQYLAAAEAYLRGIERRITAGLNPNIGSVASLSISRWDLAVNGKAPEALRDQLGIAVAAQTYKAYCSLVDTPRWQRILQAGANRQRMVWASIGTRDPEASDMLYVQALAAPFTVNTIHEATLKALANHSEIIETLTARARACDNVLARFAEAGFDIDDLADQLQDEAIRSSIHDWDQLLECIASKSNVLNKTA